MPDSIKNISVKFFDLLSRKTVLKNVRFHKCCKCVCLLDEKVCNNKQKWNKEKCRCQCLINEKCSNNSFFNVVKWKKPAALVVEECKEITDDIKKTSCVKENKTITLI